MEKVWAIVTGASGSMGREAVLGLARQGYPVVMACRNLRKGEAVRQELLIRCPQADLELRELDLGCLDSVARFAESFREERVSHLFNNAGVIQQSYVRNADGLEQTRATNYVGPYLLTRLLLPRMLPDAHIVNMVSLTCRFGRVSPDFFERQRFSPLGTYADSKLALLLFSAALSERVTQTVNVADPGVVNSNMISMGRWFDPIADLLFRPFCKRPENGVQPALRALRTESRLHYFVGSDGHRDAPISRRYRSHPSLSWLWTTTEQLLRERGWLDSSL